MAISSGRADIDLGDTLTLEIGKRMATGNEGEELFLYNPLLMIMEEGRGESYRVGEELIPKEMRTYQIVGIMETPVFVDSEPETWNMDPELLDRAIADRIEKTGRKPKAIIPVYLYGMPAK